jgi:hypothetical protein
MTPDKIMDRGSNMLKVILKSCPNPDFGQTRAPAKPQMKTVATLAEARAACIGYRDDNHLGGGNWAGGQVFDEMAPKKQVYYVSYNGRIWEPGMGGTEVILPPEPVPTDPDQRLDITCADCGKPIDFRRGEVFVNKHSYVCKDHF